jgi:hypothetical protein
MEAAAMVVEERVAAAMVEEERVAVRAAVAKEAVAMAALALGEDHPIRGLMLMNLGVVAEKLGRLEEADVHYRRAAQLTAAAWGPDHPLSLQAQDTLEAFLAALATGATAGQPSDPPAAEA